MRRLSLIFVFETSHNFVELVDRRIPDTPKNDVIPPREGRAIMEMVPYQDLREDYYIYILKYNYLFSLLLFL